MPKSAGEIRPSGEMAAASVKINPAPPTALLPKCTKCQSFGNPSSAEYWHIGETTIRFFKVSSLNFREENKLEFIIKICMMNKYATSKIAFSFAEISAFYLQK